MDQPSLDQVMEVMRAKGYPIHEPDSQEIRINIVGIRSDDREANTYDDWIFTFYRESKGGMWMNSPEPATCDPGLVYRLNPMNARGTAILKPGHYPGAYCLGSHRGTNAYVQEGYTPVTIYLDVNRDGMLDTYGMQEITGWYGINLHGPYSVDTVDYSSAGCQVWEQRHAVEHAYRLGQASVGREDARFPGRKFFDYTLITEADLG